MIPHSVRKNNPKAKKKYILLEKFADMEDVLNSTCIEGIAFRNVIMNDNTEILGQDWQVKKPDSKKESDFWRPRGDSNTRPRA